MCERSQAPSIVVWDLEVSPRDHSVLEFGAILVCRERVAVLERYTTLVRPVEERSIWGLNYHSGITEVGLIAAPLFTEIARTIQGLLEDFDIKHLKAAFDGTEVAFPEPLHVVDTCADFKDKFKKRVGTMELNDIAGYFGLGIQTHRALDDALLTLEVMKCFCAVVVLESSMKESKVAFIKANAHGQHMIEFGVKLLCPKTLVCDVTYSKLIRIRNSGAVNPSYSRNGTTSEMIESTKSFCEIAKEVREILDGNVWVVYNVLVDSYYIDKAFESISMDRRPKRNITVDLRKIFELYLPTNREIEVVAEYFGLEFFKKRTLDGARMDIELLKRCATISLLRCVPRGTKKVSTWPEATKGFATHGFDREEWERVVDFKSKFRGLTEISEASVSPVFEDCQAGYAFIQMMHDNLPLRLKFIKAAVIESEVINYPMFGRTGHEIMIKLDEESADILRSIDLRAKATIDGAR